MKSTIRATRRLASLRKELRRLRLGYARVLARRLKLRSGLPAKILAVKAKIAQLTLEVAGRGRAA
ncbi:MAG TPA: hypothetical protein VKU80_00075 [Planctomycetota bacterium]|nr:hypothetical protein [Planctomycetota bacterium]